MPEVSKYLLVRIFDFWPHAEGRFKLPFSYTHAYV